MNTTENSLLELPSSDPLTDKPGLRNAWQWLAMITMTLDHVGYLYYIPELRWVGRLGMPLYAILFAITVQKHQVHLWRVVVLALLSQVQYMYIFDQAFYVASLRLPQLNIIFGFAIFAWTAQGIHQRNTTKIVTGFLMMCIPVSYGWYLYLTLATFTWVNERWTQRGVFVFLTAVYTYVTSVHPRQLLAVCVPFLTWIKAPRPNKYLYRYFYPGHLLILALLFYGQTKLPLRWYFQPLSYETDNSFFYEDEPGDFYEAIPEYAPEEMPLQ